ncbi:MAG: DUF5721 family protein [Defluviitaleaceae bacterium]|nr:DUF5721 family protein [Defluviitaleaceae bacterium]
MQQFSIKPEYIKKFMQYLFGEDSFAEFEVSLVEIRSFATFTIDGEKPEVDKTDGKKAYCKWHELRPFARQIIKGNKPQKMKFIFAHSNPTAVHASAGSLTLRMDYENENLIFTTGISQKIFDIKLNKEVFAEWDSWVAKFFGKLGYVVQEV